MSDESFSETLTGIEADLHQAAELERAGRLQEAAALYETMLVDHSGHAEVHRRYAHLCWDQQRVDRAIEALLRSCELAPGAPRPLVDLAEIRVALGQTDEAERLLESALGLAPNDSDIQVKRALVAIQLGDREEAKKRALLAAELPNPSAGAHQLCGTLAWQDGNLEAAAEQLGQARLSVPHPADPNALLASSLFALGRGPEIASLTVCNTDSQLHSELVLQALQAWQTQKLELCRQLLERAVPLAPKVVDGPRWRAMGPIFRNLLYLMDHGLKHQDLYQGDAQDVLFLVGDSHVIPANLLPTSFPAPGGPAGSSEARLFRCRALHVVAPKAWHLTRTEANPQRAALLQVLDKLPAGAQVLFCFGDQDCRFRGGLFDHCKETGADWRGLVDNLVAAYFETILAWSAARDLRPGFVVPPAPNVQMRKIPSTDREIFLAIIDGFNDRLRDLAAGRGLPLLDLFAVTFDADSGIREDRYCDPNHVTPETYLEAFRAIGGAAPPASS